MSQPPVCFICTLPNADEINGAVTGNTPNAFIPAMFQHAFSVNQLNQHLRRCLRPNWKKAVENTRMKLAVDIDRRYALLLDEAEQGLAAARDVLLVDGELNFNPRAWEITVVYNDYNDTTDRGEPRLKTDSLDDLLMRLASQGFEPKRSYIKAEDARKGWREAISKCESLVDKVAKMLGVYKQDNSSNAAQQELDDLKAVIQKTAFKLGTSYSDEVIRFLDTYSARMRPDLRGMLEKEVSNVGALAGGGGEVKPLALSPVNSGETFSDTSTKNTG